MIGVGGVGGVGGVNRDCFPPEFMNVFSSPESLNFINSFFINVKIFFRFR